jgi:serine/threonine protein kinase
MFCGFSREVDLMAARSLHITQNISFEDDNSLELPLSAFPQEHMTGFLKDASGVSFAHIHYTSLLFEGGYGLLHRVNRKSLPDEKVVPAIVKVPKSGAYLGKEALTQWLAWQTLKKYGLESATPEVYDIFVRGKKEVCFCMEFVKGHFPYSLLAVSPTPDMVLFQILAQLCLLLGILEKEIRMDHRDLKANNIYIRERPCSYAVDLSGSRWTLSAPFQVVLLDYGFACLGNDMKRTRINVSPDIFPQSDPCPKEGRDLFHLLTSFWSIPSIRQRMTSATQKEIDTWLYQQKKDYGKLARTSVEQRTFYVITGEEGFRYPFLEPVNLLARIAQKYPQVVQRTPNSS